MGPLAQVAPSLCAGPDSDAAILQAEHSLGSAEELVDWLPLLPAPSKHLVLLLLLLLEVLAAEAAGLPAELLASHPRWLCLQ
jgi:hypothetical protein